MKIWCVNVYQVDLPLSLEYKWQGDKSLTKLDTTIVEVITSTGLKGYGEMCPFGSSYLASYAGGVRAGLRELIPHVLGADPLQLGRLNQLMDYHLKGHPYVKVALDVACWDILGKHCNLPLCTLLGGRLLESVPLYQTIVQGTEQQMWDDIKTFSEEGYTKVQLKVGGDVADDISRIRRVRKALPDDCILFFDANGAYLPHEALRVVEAVKDLDVYIEQPCDTYEENLFVRNRTNLPFLLDENIEDIGVLLKAAKDRAGDVLKLKICMHGGLTKAKQVRDLCVSLGMAVCVEVAWGSDITMAAIAHLAQSTPQKCLFGALDLSSYTTLRVAERSPERVNGRISVSEAPGLGIEPIMGILGEPIMSFEVDCFNLRPWATL